MTSRGSGTRYSFGKAMDARLLTRGCIGNTVELSAGASATQCEDAAMHRTACRCQRRASTDVTTIHDEKAGALERGEEQKRWRVCKQTNTANRRGWTTPCAHAEKQRRNGCLQMKIETRHWAMETQHVEKMRVNKGWTEKRPD